MFVFFCRHKIVARQHGLDPAWGGGCSRLFLQFSFLLFLVDIKVYMFVFLQRKGGRDCEGPVWGEEGWGGERESVCVRERERV